MQVKVNSNHTIHTGESLERWATEHLNESLSRFKEDITSIDVHMSDENGDKVSPDHKRCMMEARLAHYDPVAVNNSAANVDDAFRGAADKLKRALDHMLGKAKDHRSRDSIRHEPDLDPV